MDFRDALSPDLPARRDDEPDSLRDDIIDELADHLACAYRRELLRGMDPTTARHHVLDEFGDPAAVARRLWFDAMKGKIMSKRILVAYSIVLTLVCLVSLGVATFSSIRAARAEQIAAEAHARAAQEMWQAQQAKDQMQKQLQATSKGANSPGSTGKGQTQTPPVK